MHHVVATPVMLAELMDLGMAIVAPGDAIIRFRCLNLFVFYPSEFESLFLESGL